MFLLLIELSFLSPFGFFWLSFFISVEIVPFICSSCSTINCASFLFLRFQCKANALHNQNILKEWHRRARPTNRTYLISSIYPFVRDGEIFCCRQSHHVWKTFSFHAIFSCSTNRKELYIPTYELPSEEEKKNTLPRGLSLLFLLIFRKSSTDRVAGSLLWVSDRSENCDYHYLSTQNYVSYAHNYKYDDCNNRINRRNEDDERRAKKKKNIE